MDITDGSGGLAGRSAAADAAITKGDSAGAGADRAEAAGPSDCFVVWPHRSLPRSGKLAVLGAVGLAMLAVLIGTPGIAPLPLVVSCLAAPVALATAFWANGRSARVSDEIQIGPKRVQVIRSGAAAEPRVEEFNTAWVRIVVSSTRTVAHRITLAEGRRGMAIGEYLSPEEREMLAGELRASLATQRRLATQA